MQECCVIGKNFFLGKRTLDEAAVRLKDGDFQVDYPHKVHCSETVRNETQKIFEVALILTGGGGESGQQKTPGG